MISHTIVTILVIWSMWMVFKTIAPQSAYRLQLQFSQWLMRRAWKRLGQWVRPDTQKGCNGGCGCTLDRSSQSDTVQPVKWK